MKKLADSRNDKPKTIDLKQKHHLWLGSLYIDVKFPQLGIFPTNAIRGLKLTNVPFSTAECYYVVVFNDRLVDSILYLRKSDAVKVAKQHLQEAKKKDKYSDVIFLDDDWCYDEEYPVIVYRVHNYGRRGGCCVVAV